MISSFFLLKSPFFGVYSSFFINKWPIQGIVSITESPFFGVCSSFFTSINDHFEVTCA